jgi:hypothetical protein
LFALKEGLKTKEFLRKGLPQPPATPTFLCKYFLVGLVVVNNVQAEQIALRFGCLFDTDKFGAFSQRGRNS